MSEPGTVDGLAVSVSGPDGVVDLLVPPDTEIRELAQRYRDESGAIALPLVFTVTGTPLPPDRTVGDLGLGSGALLVAAFGVPRPPQPGEPAASPASPARPAVSRPAVAIGGLGVAVALAALAAVGVVEAALPLEQRMLVGALLALGALTGLLDIGPYAAARAAVAPAFAAAAVLVWTWRPEAEALPVVLGVAGLGGCVAAAVLRMTRSRSTEPLVVWMVAGGGLFAVAAAAALAGLPPAAVWSAILVVALYAARIAPALAIDVPDQLLVDLERLAVTAWSARDRQPGRRGRTVVSTEAMTALAAHGARTVAAASVAIAALAGLASYLSLETDRPLDGAGARWLVGLTGAGLLLAARQHRHPGSRAALAVGGLVCLGLLAARLLSEATPPALWWCAVSAVGLGLLVVIAGVAAGRGWRSVWWSRRAELAETVCLVGAVAAGVVSTGAFRTLWEIASVRFGG